MHGIKRVKKFIFLSLFILVFSFVNPVEVKADTAYNFNFEVVKCDPTAEGMTAAKCRNNYVSGALDSYKVLNNGDLEPGNKIMVVVKLGLGMPKTMTAFQAFFSYDSNMYTPLLSSDGNNILNSTNNKKYPYYYDEDNDSNEYGWIIEVNKDEDVIRMAAYDLTYFKPLTSNVDVAYLFFEVNSDAVPGSSGGFVFDTDPGSTNGNDKDGTTLMVSATNATFNVYGSQSRDASLKTLTATNGGTNYPLTPSFVPSDSTTKEYTVYVPNSISSIDLNATANSEYATIASSSLGTKSLNVGNNEFDIVITAQFGNIETYKLNVYKLSNDATLSNISLTNGISIGNIVAGQYTYGATIPYAKTSTNISITPTHGNAFTETTLNNWQLSNYGSTVNTKAIIVKAENCLDAYSTVPNNTCSTKTYTLNINRENPSTNNYLSNLKVDGLAVTNFNKNTLSYNLSNVSNDTTSITINATVEDSKATIISGTGSSNLKVGNNSISIKAKAEDGTIKTYVINVRRLSNESSLSSLTFSSNPAGTLSPAFTSAFTGDYTYSYDPTVTNISVTAVVKDTGKASVMIADVSQSMPVNTTGTLNSSTVSFNNEVTKIAAIVTAEDGSIKIYQVNMDRQKSTNNYLSALTVSNTTLSPVFTPTTKNYTATVPGNIQNVTVEATPAVNYASVVSIIGNTNLSFGNNTIEVIVEAENGVQTSYFVNLTREKYDVDTLSSISVDSSNIEDFNSNELEYTLPNVPFSKTSLTLGATKTNSYSSVTGLGNISLNTGDNEIKIKVTAHNGVNTKTYKLHVYREKNSDNSVKGITVAGSIPTLNSSGKYIVTLPNNKTSLTPSDVIISASEDAVVSKDETINLTTENVNEYGFAITAENGEVNNYTILITREKSNNANISRVNLSIGSDDSRYCLISNNKCTIGVPVDTTSFNLNAVIDSKATVNPTNGTSYSMTNEQSTRDIILIVTAEDGTIKNYTVTVERQKSSNNNLNSLTINGTSVTNFLSSTQVYNEVVVGTVENVIVAATVEDTGKATITTSLVNAFNLNFGSNQIDVTVKAENGDTKTYTIFVTRKKRTDATLSDLKINGVTISGFDSLITEYVLENVDYNTNSLVIGATTNDTLAAVSGTGLSYLNTGDNVITLSVSAHDTSVTKLYKINVNRAKNSDTGIQSVTVSGVNAVFNNELNKYEVTVPNSVSSVGTNNIVVTPNNGSLATDAKASVSLPTLNLTTTNVNNYEFTVTAENGATKKYALAITREKSNVATLDSLTVSNGSFSPSFNKDTHEYIITLPVDTTSYTISATPTDSNATITSGTGNYVMNSSTKTTEVVVLSEDGTTLKKYKLNINRTKSSVNTLSGISVDNGTLSPTFTSSETNYVVNVEGNVEQINIGATLTDDRATIESGPGLHNLIVGENPIEIKVKSESGSILNYNVKVVRAKKADSKLTNLAIDGVSLSDFSASKTEYTLENVPYSKTSLQISATTSDVDASVAGDGIKSLATGANVFDVIVTAQNGTTTTYKINVSRAKNTDATLSILSVSGSSLTPNFDGNTLNYETTVAETKSVLSPSDISAVATDSNATIVKQEQINLSTTSDNYYSVTVTAEDGITKKIYKIKVNRPKSSDISLSNVEVTGATLSPNFSKTTYEYTITVPYNSTLFTIQGTPNVATTTVIGNGEYTTSNSVVQLTTTAENGDSKIYKFNVIQALSNDATLSNLSVNGYNFDKTFLSTTLNYNIGDVPYGTTSLRINAAANNANASLSYYVDGVLQNSNVVNIPQTLGSKNIEVKVTAADSITTKTYVISYNMASSNNAYLSNITSSVGTINFNKTAKIYNLTVDNNVTSLNLNITSEDVNASIKINNNSYFTPKTITASDLKVGNNTVSILVTAQDGVTTETYSVIINRLPLATNNDAYLSSLSVDGYSLDKTFVMTSMEYNIGTIPYGLTSLKINATKNYGKASISYYVAGIKQTNNIITLPKQNGNGTIIVKVTAEDGTTINNYTIKYNKQASTNAFLSNIITSSGTLTFNKNVYTYQVNVSSDVNNLDLTVTTEDAKATMKINDVVYASPHTLSISSLSPGNTEVTIIVTSESNISLTYKVTIVKQASIDNTITSNLYGHSIINGYIKTVKVGTKGLELKNQLDNSNEYLEIWSSDESRIIEDNEILGTGMIVKLKINGIEKDRKYIVIKGDTSGDGEIDLFDAVKILNHYLEKSMLTTAYKEAAYTNDDAEIDLFDSVMILNHYLGKISLH